MALKLDHTLTLEKQPGEWSVFGQTCSEVDTTGTRTEWRLGNQGHPDLVIHDTRWRNGERDVVISRPEDVPPMPKPLSALLGRRRSQVVPHGEFLRMAVVLVHPDSNGWPKRRFCSLEELQDACGPQLFGALHDHGVTRIDTREAILGDDSRQRNRLLALLDPAEESAPIVLYTVTHIVPTLKHIAWL